MPTQLSPFLPHLLVTLQQRPYVFFFLIVFLIFATLQLGWQRMLLFLGLGWVIAFASEVSSIRNGFPYGNYQYVYENLKGELLLWGVPLWDSLSYTFLAYASYSTAVLISLSLQRRGLGRGLQFSDRPLPPSLSKSKEGANNSEEFAKIRTSWKVLFLSMILMTGIDVIIDPLTNMGDRWFLGRIYYYPNGGQYFGVTISNFIGWAIVAFVIIGIFQLCDKLLESKEKNLEYMKWKGLRAYLGAALYLGVYFFNWGITIYLKEWKLVIADLIWISPLVLLLMLKRREAY